VLARLPAAGRRPCEDGERDPEPRELTDVPGGAVPEHAGTVRAVCVGAVGVLDRGPRPVRSAMVKTPVDGPVPLGPLGLPGDAHVYEHHGGPDMALLVCSHDHHAFWRARGLELPDAGAFGENLTVDGLVEDDVWLGDTFGVGTAVVQVTQPRTPCYKLAARFGRKDVGVLMQQRGATGYLLRVLEPGTIAAGDELRLVAREDHGVTVAEAGRIVNVDRRDLDGTRRVLAVPSLGSAVRRALLARLDGARTPADDDADAAARLFGT
jgi:MOSC domain-containing protein YiiM